MEESLRDSIGWNFQANSTQPHMRPAKVKIAVAYDDAFCFYYRTSLEALREAGAELLFFSPIHDDAVPVDASALYLGGGYPELFLKELSRNESMKESILSALGRSMPCIAECGGFMYLHRTVRDTEGHCFGMAGFIDGEAYFTGSLRRFGYSWLSCAYDSMLFKAGERIPAHEFHYYESTAKGADLVAEKANGKRRFSEGYAGASIYAGFPHLELSGELPLAQRFVCAARDFAFLGADDIDVTKRCKERIPDNML